MGEKVQTGLWWAWLTEYPDEGSVVVEADDEATAQAAGATLLREDTSRVAVEACTPDTLKTGPARVVDAGRRKAEMLAESERDDREKRRQAEAERDGLKAEVEGLRAELEIRGALLDRVKAATDAGMWHDAVDRVELLKAEIKSAAWVLVAKMREDERDKAIRAAEHNASRVIAEQDRREKAECELEVIKASMYCGHPKIAERTNEHGTWCQWCGDIENARDEVKHWGCVADTAQRERDNAKAEAAGMRAALEKAQAALADILGAVAMPEGFLQAGHDALTAARNVLDGAIGWKLRCEMEDLRRLKDYADRLGLDLRYDGERVHNKSARNARGETLWFTASIPGAGRGDGTTWEEAVDALKARLVENAIGVWAETFVAGPAEKVRAEAAELKRINADFNSGLVDIWTDLGKPYIGPESFVTALAEACRWAIAATQERAAWAEAFAAELTCRSARDPDEVVKAERERALLAELADARAALAVSYIRDTKREAEYWQKRAESDPDPDGCRRLAERLDRKADTLTAELQAMPAAACTGQHDGCPACDAHDIKLVEEAIAEQGDRPYLSLAEFEASLDETPTRRARSRERGTCDGPKGSEP